MARCQHTISRVTHVAVLGAGIMGASTALFLARGGVRVTLFDAASAVCAGASRWNEGKIHLGHLYAADPSLRTAARLLPGGLAFRRLIEDLVGRSLEPALSPHDDLYLVHRHSVVDATAAARYYDAVTALAAGHREAARYLVPIRDRRAARLSSTELARVTDAEAIVAGFRVPERSVSTRWIADRLVEAVDATPRITRRLDTRVTAIATGVHGLEGPFSVTTTNGDDGPYDAVVNALWEGRLAIDAALHLRTPATWSHRYRVAVFLRTTRPVTMPNAVIATGPFGDAKNYNGRDLYLSWYDTGLLSSGTGLAPPARPDLDEVRRSALADEVIARLGAVLPGVRDLTAITESRQVSGGWVFAAGHGALDDPASTLHRRDRIGITRHDRYVSVDTGKYSVAPWLARTIADMLL